jgi:hypothetical protein
MTVTDLLQVFLTRLTQAVHNKLLRACCHQLVSNLLRDKMRDFYVYEKRTEQEFTNGCINYFSIYHFSSFGVSKDGKNTTLRRPAVVFI